MKFEPAHQKQKVYGLGAHRPLQEGQAGSYHISVVVLAVLGDQLRYVDYVLFGGVALQHHIEEQAAVDDVALG